ncbi:leucine-rich repeat-containing protein 57-like isoform X2 [Agrilus planipennis]|uniref:Leucine-rich repeat-containing protein 57-like isoform X2 n=1 Tax=Agrilus planipennis TaxID=224129 RepID=A0A1W4W4Q8_AGRPL|nr:leucine-rich repeat-containing protein 57-like isoform X2 [Agrilus planipennis]
MCYCRISTHILQFFITMSLAFCKGDTIICNGDVNSRLRLFQNISDYHFTTIGFNPMRKNFRGNYVGFKSGNMEILERNFFATFDSQNILKMYLHHQNIKKIDPGAFLFMDCLKTLDLHANEIESLSDEIFLNLDRIEELDLSDNKLQEILPLTFNHTRTLKSLNLSNNKLERLSINSFFQLRHLEKLNLSYNALTNISDTTFDHLICLKILLLNGNKLMKINPEKWYNLFHLKVLDLSKNFLSNFDTGYKFSFGMTLSCLNLTDNRLTQLNIFGLLKNIPNVSVLGIQQNRWLCSDLELMLNILRGSNISYVGTSKKGAQIDGISCYNRAEEIFSPDKHAISEIKRNADYHFNGLTHQAQIMMIVIMCLLE